MILRKISQEFYDLLVRAFRSTPGEYSPVARILGCDRRTAKRGWELGWPPKFEAVSVVFERETKEAQAVLVREKLATSQKEREEDRIAAVKRAQQVELEKRAEKILASDQRKAEVQLALGMRSNTLRLLLAQERMVTAALQLVPQIERMIASGELSGKEAMVALYRLTTNQGTLNAAAKQLLELTRLINGEPQSIVAVTSANMTVEEAAEIIKQAPSLAKRAQELGLLVLPGEYAAASSTPVQPALSIVPKSAG